MMSAPVLVIARLTLREAARRRLLLAVVVLTVVLVALSAWSFGKLTSLSCDDGVPCSPTETKMIAAMLVILITFMYSFVFTLGAVFVAVPTVASEVESGVTLAMLPRPIRRSDIILGKWLGWAIIAGGYTIVTTGLEFIAVQAVVGYTPPHPITAILFLLGECLVMLTLGLLFSTRLAPMTGGIIALVLFGLAWMGGVAHGVGTLLESDAVRNIGLVSSLILPTDGLWRGALFNIEPSILTEVAGASRAMAANPFLTHTPPSAAYITWAVAWVIIMLGLSILSFERREP